MTKKIVFGLVVLIFIFLLASGGIFLYIKKLQSEPIIFDFDKNYELSQEDAFLLNKSTVVRIATTINGEVDVPDFKVNVDNLGIEYIEGAEPVTIPIENERLAGTGHIVGKDGFILTNAHVVSNNTIKYSILENLLVAMFTDEILRFALTATEGEIEKFEELLKKVENNDPEITKQLEDDMYALLDKMESRITKGITVLNPSTGDVTIDQRLEEGFKATMVSVNDEYMKDNRDIALIKIDQENLPTTRYADSSSITVGDQVHVFGYPAAATFNESDFTEATLTKGLISAQKKSENGDFDIIQTDAKISQGSSGGPLFDKGGNVIGMITYQTDEAEQDTGDAFAFAIPSSIVKNGIDEFYVNENVEVPEGILNSSFMNAMEQGKQLHDSKHCQQALEKFVLAESLNTVFGGKDFPEKYKNECKEMIARDESIDTMWDVKKQELAQIDRNVLIFGVIGVIIGTILIIVIIVLFARIRSNKKAISQNGKVLDSSDQEVEELNAKKEPKGDNNKIVEKEDIEISPISDSIIDEEKDKNSDDSQDQV